MTLGRQETVDGLLAELEAFESLVRSMDESDADTASRCAGWTAGDVARHVVGQLADVANGRFDGLGTPEATGREVAERAGRAPKELADELAEMRAVGAAILAAIDDDGWEQPGPGGIPGTLGSGVEALWFDAWLHADDIRNALGQPTVAGPGVRVSISHLADALADDGWGPATLALDGVEPVTVGAGGGRTVTGDPIEFVLAATGRGDPAALGLDDTVNIYRG
jgi:uncharacterized protein (TIGR03083 family)